MASHKGSAIKPRASGGTIRCVIYTRKREACAAYVLSQQHEGWTLLPDYYDDGGYSGGSMDRPAVKRLLADVALGKVDVIVVYKVDRLTRSLADFAKIVDVLDAAKSSFVSVTQAFNTTNSMGRLTLNVLLSFAQFEREVTGERIRDKIALSKAKGMWMGGPVPLGYAVRNRALEVVDEEAATVRQIFEVHQTVPTLRALAGELEQLGVRSRVRQMRDGTTRGGVAFTAGALRHILTNHIYLGEVSHKTQVYPGAHRQIIERALWSQAQAGLVRAKPRPRLGLVSPLAGRIHDAAGQGMVPAHANKAGRRYRYYVSAAQVSGSCWRLPAGDLEAIVHRSLIALLSDPVRLFGEFGGQADRAALATRGRDMAMAYAKPSSLAELLRKLEGGIVVAETSIRISIDRQQLADMFAVARPPGSLTEPVEVDVPASLRRRGHELRLVYATPHMQPAQRDERLIELIGKGWAAWDQLNSTIIFDPTRRSHLTRLARLKFLAPDITTAILDGRQPVELTARTLLRLSDLPIAWADQRVILGFA